MSFKRTKKEQNGFFYGSRREKSGSRPISRVLSWTIIHLGVASPQLSSNLPGNTCGPQAARMHVPLFGLAPDGVCPATTVASCAVRSYRTISPLPAPQSIGGIFSVALSVGSLRPGITWHPVLWSPDFPLPQAAAIIWPTPACTLVLSGKARKDS